MWVRSAVEGNKTYEVCFLSEQRKNAVEFILDWLELHPSCGQIILVTDAHVAKVQGTSIDRLLKGITDAKPINTSEYIVPEGEASKSLKEAERIWSHLAESGFTRNDLLIAFGGGMIGDLVGFCASTYLRGVGFIQMPTTLLAQIDSSIGGKVAINLPQGKNLVGQFYNPEGVIIDVTYLQTLQTAVLQDGLGELIKYAFMGDTLLLDWLKSLEDLSELERIIINDPHSIEGVIQRCVQIKRVVAEKDFKEVHERKWLNLGHTFGHAIEQAEGYRLGHGYCVVLGLYLAGEIGWRLGTSNIGLNNEVSASQELQLASKAGYERFVGLLYDVMRRFNFSWDLTVGHEMWIPYLLQDKKRVSADTIQMILPRFEAWSQLTACTDEWDSDEAFLSGIGRHLKISPVPIGLLNQNMMRSRP